MAKKKVYNAAKAQQKKNRQLLINSQKATGGKTPDYVFRGEAPMHMQRSAAHPLQGGNPS